jgi:hypothetical protein
MRTTTTVLFVMSVTATMAIGCAEQLPETAPMTPAADRVEVVSEKPNKDLYQAVGEVTARMAGSELNGATREAKNALRNQAASRGASLVWVDDTTADTPWNGRGKVIVAMSGTAYKPR